MDYTFIIFITLVFVAVVLGLEGAFTAWNSSRGPAASRIARRLRAMDQQGGVHKASMIRERLLSKSAPLQSLLESISVSSRLDTMLLQSGLSWNLAYLLGLIIAFALAGLAMGSFFGLAWLFILAVAIMLALLPVMFVRRARTSLAARVPVTDLRFFVIAVMIQRETGGNLAELLNNITVIMRDRVKLFAKVRVLSAEGKMSAWILSLLPFGAGLLIQVTNPKFLAILFTDPSGRTLIYLALGLMVIGIFAMRRIIDIKV